MSNCKNCGGLMIGDGHTLPLHCEAVDVPADREADAPALYCKATKPDTHAQLIAILHTIGEAARDFALVDWTRANIDDPHLSADCDAIRRHFDSLSGRLSQAARHVGAIDRKLNHAK